MTSLPTDARAALIQGRQTDDLNFASINVQVFKLIAFVECPCAPAETILSTRCG
jgi:hypothetical protein